MKEHNLNKIFEKYKKGNSSLDEENILFENANNLNTSFKAWSNFARNNKIETPKDFNDTIWESFENKINNKHKSRFKIVIMSAAASILLIIAFFIGNTTKKELSYDQKAALLNEALSMFSDNKQNNENIIYENETIVIYTSIE